MFHSFVVLQGFFCRDIGKSTDVGLPIGWATLAVFHFSRVTSPDAVTVRMPSVRQAPLCARSGRGRQLKHVREHPPWLAGDFE